MTLNWANDPVLFDSEPAPANHWVNANELLDQSRREDIFHADGRLKLYPIMVRKNDFVRKKSSDRIMARFPFFVIDEQTQGLIKDKILNLSELTRNYFYKSINKPIMEWKKVIANYLKKGKLPYPIYRCSFELDHRKSTHCNTKFLLHFASARGETFTFPTKLTKKMTYLCGVCNGDGNLQKYTLRIVDYSIKNIKQLQEMFEKYFDQTGNILFKTPNCPEVVITNLWVVRLFSFLTDQRIGGKKYHALQEPLIFQNNPTFRSFYWSGVMDSDGSYKSRNVKFVSASLRYAKDFKNFLLMNKIGSKLTENDDNTVVVYIPNRFHDRLKKLLTCLHPEKKKEFNKLSTSHVRTPTFFAGFIKSSLINGFFDFKLINNLSVDGLGKTMRQFRGRQSRKAFINKLNISERALQDIEKGKMSINILLLDIILKQKNLLLMPFLSQKKSLSYHIRGSEQVILDTRPNKTLASLLEPLKFYKNRIKIPRIQPNLVQELEDHFKISIQDYMITNKLLLKFFSIFCETKLLEN